MRERIIGLSPIVYLYKRTLVNRIKKALKKPVTYILLLFFGGYLVMLVGIFSSAVLRLPMPPASTLTAFLTIVAFIFTPANLISYSRRKGLVFRKSDVHFLFPSPVGPKKILLYAHLRTIVASVFLELIIVAAGIFQFGIPAWKMLAYFVFSCFVENILEGSLMLLCYGTERFSGKQMLSVQAVMYAIIGFFVLFGVAVCLKRGVSFASVLYYLHSPAIQMVPVIGWNIAFLHLLFMGPTAVNIVCSLLFVLSAAALCLAASRMKCTGGYYEDAEKFADDYEEARARGKKGEVAAVGRKKKLGSAEVTYKGGGARALFYRQLLEYRKQRFFIFGFNTLLSLGTGAVLAVLGARGELGGYAPFIVLGVMAYFTFIFSSYLGKWGKELEKPYTYLIPDSPFHKLWYSTLIEHIRALIDGCLIAVPVGVVLRMPLLRILLMVMIYVCLQACRLYAAVLVQAFLGNLLGSTARAYMRLFFESLVIGIGIAGAAVGTVLISMDAGFFILILLCAAMTAGIMAAASINFDRMESLE